MYIINKLTAYLGILLCLISGFCPFLKVPFKGNWNLYQVDSRLFLITYAFIGILMFALFIRKLLFFRLMAVLLFVWYVLALGLAYFKVNNYFSFKFVDRMLSKTIHFQWGWIVLLVGIILVLFSVKKLKSTVD